MVKATRPKTSSGDRRPSLIRVLCHISILPQVHLTQSNNVPLLRLLRRRTHTVQTTLVLCFAQRIIVKHKGSQGFCKEKYLITTLGSSSFAPSFRIPLSKLYIPRANHWSQD